MKKYLTILFISVLTMQLSGQANFYDNSAQTINGEDFDFSSLKGKKVLIVNTASKCGLTPQYEELQKLWEQYGGDDFVIIGFPANNFMNQEPGSDTEIKEFCTENYGVTFPMMSKISVKGKDMHPVYKWLTSKELNGVEDSKVSWNFQKYLVSENGTLEKVLKPRVQPDDPQVLDWLNE